MAESVGEPMDRVDGRAKVTGKATYAAEFPVEHVVHAAIVESSIAEGRVTSVDARAAERATGVLAVFSPDRAPRLAIDPRVKQNGQDRFVHVFQDHAVQYLGQPVALVVADTFERATHAAALVVVRYQEERPRADFQAALPTAFAPKSTNPERPATSHSGTAKSTPGPVGQRHLRHALRAPQPDGAARHHRPLGRGAALRLRRDPRHLQRTPAVGRALWHPGEERAGSLEVSRRRFRMQGVGLAAHRPRGDGRAGAETAGQARPDPHPDVQQDGAPSSHRATAHAAGQEGRRTGEGAARDDQLHLRVRGVHRALVLGDADALPVRGAGDLAAPDPALGGNPHLHARPR